MLTDRIYVTARALRKILRFVTKRHMVVKVRYDENDSNGETYTIAEIGVIQKYSVKTIDMGGYKEFHIYIIFDDGREMEINRISNQWEFAESRNHNGPVMVGPSGCGPDNYFFIRKIDKQEVIGNG